jgi:hypothetical protein
MNSHNAQKIFVQALEIVNPAERRADLDQSSAGDSALRSEVM